VRSLFLCLTFESSVTPTYLWQYSPTFYNGGPRLLSV